MRYLLLSLLVSCSGASLRYDVKGNMTSMRLFQRDGINQALDIIVDVASSRWDRAVIIKQLSKLRVSLCDPTFMGVHRDGGPRLNVCQVQGANFAGVHLVGDRRIRWAHRTGFCHNAFGHEVLHYLVYRLDGNNMHDKKKRYIKQVYLDMDREITERMCKNEL